MTNLVSRGDSAEFNEHLQLAQSLKYSSAIRCGIAELRPGLFALYGPNAEVLYVGDDWNEALEYYRARPTYKPPVRPMLTKGLRGIDTSKLRFTI